MKVRVPVFKYRLEVKRPRSEAWEIFLKLARRFKTYRVQKDGKLELHVIETNSDADVAALYEYIRGWQGWLFYIKGKPAAKTELTQIHLKKILGTGAYRIPGGLEGLCAPILRGEGPSITYGPDIHLSDDDEPPTPPPLPPPPPDRPKRPWERR